MAINKIVLNTEDGEQVLVDLTGDTVTAETLAEGVTAHDKSGVKITGTMTGGGEDVTAETNEYTNKLATLETAIAELEAELEGKASGGGGGGDNANYAKFTVKPTSSTSLTIENPLGGIAKCFVIRRLSEETPTARRIYEYIGTYSPPLGACKCTSTSDTGRYAVQRTSGSISNTLFTITEGEIKAYRYNSANIWDTTSEYEVEIFQ